MGLYSEIMTTVDSSCQNFIQGNVVAIAEGIKDPAFTLLGAYVLFWGFSHLLNLVSEPITDSLKRLIKLIFILGIAFQVTTYNSYITDTITKGPEELASLFTGTNSSGQMVSTIDKIFEDTWDVGNKFWDSAGVFDGNFGFYFVAIIIYAVACALSAYSAFLIILSKVAVSVLVALGPLFIISTLFDSTKRFFENWVGMLANYGLIIVLVIGVNKFILDIFNTYLAQAIANNALEVASAAPITVTAIISCFVLAQVLSIASGLGGGISLATMGAGRWAASKLTTTAKAGARTAGSAATRKARSSLASWRSRGSAAKG